MFLKSMEINNYRKFGTDKNRLVFANKPKVVEGMATTLTDKMRIAENTTLIVGKNNTGKTTAINLLARLSESVSGTSKTFKMNDFNLGYLQGIYEKYKNDFNEMSIHEKMNHLPHMFFEIEIGIDDLINSSFSNFEDILIMADVDEVAEHEMFKSANKASEDNEEESTNQDYPTFKIQIKYEPNNSQKFIDEIEKLMNGIQKQCFVKESIEKLTNQGFSKLGEGTEYTLDELRNIETEKRNELHDKPIKNDDEANIDEFQIEEKLDRINALSRFIRYTDNDNFHKFLKIVDEASFKLNFYPYNNDTPAKKFSFGKLFEVKTIKANNIDNQKCLSDAYNKIINARLKKDGNEPLEKNLREMNYTIMDIVDDNYTVGLNKVIQEVESANKLKMNLRADVTLNHILGNSVTYEYLEKESFIPEEQFGLGYTNLMVIIAELVDYIESYKKDNTRSKINIIEIEEPETFMHPQMQELFMVNIEKAIHKLIDDREHDFGFQLIISTHSSHVLNSKIQAGNTFDNINYLNTDEKDNTARVIPISDKLLLNDAVGTTKNGEKESLMSSLKYIKKHMTLSTSELFFADSVIFVEGATEETLLKYKISLREGLNKFYISVININGAHGKVYFNLLKRLEIPCVIYTDLDLKRNNPEEYQQVKTLKDDVISDKDITTNSTLKFFLKELTGKSKNIDADDFINQNTSSSVKFLKYELGNIVLFSQGCINKYFATSLEEAIILENHNCADLNEMLSKIIPQLYKEKVGEFDKIRKESEGFNKTIENSFYFQKKLSSKKSEFMNEILFSYITNPDSFELRLPDYLEEGLQYLEKRLGVVEVDY